MKHRVTADRTLLGQAALLVAAGLLLARRKSTRLNSSHWE